MTLTIGTHRLTQTRYERCSSMVRGTNNEKLRLNVQSLDINCLKTYSYDWLEIFEGTNASQPLIRKRLCEENALKPFTSTSNELFIRFESEVYGDRMGYNITIEKGIMFLLDNR